MLFVNHMKYECCARGTTCNDQRSLFPSAGGLGCFELPVVLGQNPDGVQAVKFPEALEIIQFTLAKNSKNTLVVYLP